jgi:hypothetical protein
MTTNLRQYLFTYIFVLSLGITPLFTHLAAGVQMHSSACTDHSEKLFGAVTVSHPGTNEALTIKLDESFREITEARDANGYIKKKAAQKAHEANIKDLRNTLRHHTLLACNDEYQYGANGP